MIERHLDAKIEQAAAWNQQYVVHFKGPQDLEFYESFRDEYELARGKHFWRGFDPPFRTKHVYDVDYWIDRPGSRMLD